MSKLEGALCRALIAFFTNLLLMLIHGGFDFPRFPCNSAASQSPTCLEVGLPGRPAARSGVAGCSVPGMQMAVQSIVLWGAPPGLVGLNAGLAPLGGGL